MSAANDPRDPVSGSSRSAAAVGAEVFHRVQTTPGQWDGAVWRPLGLTAGSIAVASGQGTLHLFATGEDGQVFHAHQTTSGGAVWTPLGAARR
jgi:hypothetical protein